MRISIAPFVTKNPQAIVCMKFTTEGYLLTLPSKHVSQTQAGHSIPRRETLPASRKLHRSEINRRMSVEKSLEPLAPAGIRSNVGQ